MDQADLAWRTPTNAVYLDAYKQWNKITFQNKDNPISYWRLMGCYV